MIIIKGRRLLFDNYCWHEYVKRVDWDNMLGSSNKAALYGALAAAAYDEGTEKPDWKEVGEFMRTFEPEDNNKLKDAFEAMNEWKAFVKKVEDEVELSKEVTKKKPSKASKKTLK